MQTFLPYPNLKKSLNVLDSRRLGKQRVEAFQILNIILKRTDKKGWKNHPAVKMWKGYANALKLYFNKAVKLWISRGFKNTMKLEKIKGKITLPKWFGNEKFHASHRSNLLRKDKKYYSNFRWREKDNLEYVWPVK
ncbi:MAG: MSMEG_6728 family protein [Nanoarchaeota archaeon]